MIHVALGRTWLSGSSSGIQRIAWAKCHWPRTLPYKLFVSFFFICPLVALSIIVKDPSIDISHNPAGMGTLALVA